MTQALVFDRDNTHPDPVKDKQGSYKTGYVVAVVGDTHVFSAAEQLPPFRVVSLVGPVFAWQHLLISEDESPKKRLPESMQMMPRVFTKLAKTLDRDTVTRRRFKLDAADNLIDMTRP